MKPRRDHWLVRRLRWKNVRSAVREGIVASLRADAEMLKESIHKDDQQMAKALLKAADVLEVYDSE